jgi:dTDP-D-glucose 4,6-dehydratase
MLKSILITGGAGFIGSHVVKLFVTTYPQYRIVNLDALTYAGNLEMHPTTFLKKQIFKRSRSWKQFLRSMGLRMSFTWQQNLTWIVPFLIPLLL